VQLDGLLEDGSGVLMGTTYPVCEYATRLSTNNQASAAAEGLSRHESLESDEGMKEQRAQGKDECGARKTSYRKQSRMTHPGKWQLTRQVLRS